MTLRKSLLERNHEVGVFVGGSDVTIDASVIRTTRSRADGTVGRGVVIQHDPDTGERADVKLRASLLEQNHDTGVSVVSSDATSESTVVRDTQPAPDGAFGRGISIAARASLTLRASLLQQNHEAGVHVEGSEATIEAIVVRATQPAKGGAFGRGIDVNESTTTHEPATLRLHASLVEHNHDSGMFVAGSDATIEASVVRATQPSSAGTSGSGIQIQDSPTAKARPTLALRSSLLEQNNESGVDVIGAHATIESTIVRATQPNSDRLQGRGIVLWFNKETKARGSLTLRTSLLEQNHEVGVGVMGSDATLESTVVRATQPPTAGTDGVGIVVESAPSSGERGRMTLRTSLVEQHLGSGVFVFSSDMAVEATVVRAIELNRNGQFGRGIEIQEFDTYERATLSLRGSVVVISHTPYQAAPRRPALRAGAAARVNSGAIFEERAGPGTGVVSRRGVWTGAAPSGGERCCSTRCTK